MMNRIIYILNFLRSVFSQLKARSLTHFLTFFLKDSTDILLISASNRFMFIAAKSFCAYSHQSPFSGCSIWATRKLCTRVSPFSFNMYCRKVSLRTIRMNLTGIVPNSRWRKADGVEVGSSKIFLSRILSIFSS